jgi:fatty-acyl-CoA synthase
VAAFAVARIGALLVPVNTFASREELHHILRHSDASVLLMQSELLRHRFLDDLLAEYPEVAGGVPGRLRCNALPQLRRVVCTGLVRPRGGVETWDDLLAHGDDVSDELCAALAGEVHPADDALLIYTSGTTALPKGVVHSQRAAALQAHRFVEILAFDGDERVYTTYPFFWTAGIAMSIGATFAAGGCLLLQETFDAEQALDLIEAERATAVHAWPHQHKAMGEHPSAAQRDLRALRKVDFTSPLAALAGIEKDEYGPGASYGLSETFTIASALPAMAPLGLRTSTHGKPLPGMSFRIVDPATGATLPAGEDGEIAVKGATFMRGYQKTLPEHYLDENGFFHTQDGGCLDEQGYLHWTGRLSNIIKTGGANVSPVEIEDALEGHLGVKHAAAVAVGHPTLGEIVVLCVVPTEGAAVEEAAIRGFLRGKLAAYKVPRRVFVFHEDELAFTGNQKLQLEPLREAALARLEACQAEIEGHRYAPR